MEDYLKPYKWTYLKETVFTSNLSTQNSGHFRITNGISKPRHVFVFFINNANINNQLQNSFLYNTFSLSTNPRTLNRCYLEVGNGNEYPRIHYKPTEDPSRVFRDVMKYVNANNDLQGGTLQNISNLSGNDELMLSKTQLGRIQKSLANGTGVDLKISKTQIRKIAKHGGNLFTSLATLGAKVLPYAVKGVSKAVPALSTGAVSALGSLGIDKIFGKGINIPKKFFPMLPRIVNELTQSQIDQINRVAQSGGGLVLKPTGKQIEGGFLGTLASIGIPMAISLVSKMFGGGLQVDKAPQIPKKMSNVYLPQDGGLIPMYPPPFYGNWNETVGMGKKTGKGNKKGQGLLLGKNSPFNAIPILGDIL